MRYAIITGASGGIGRATAKLLCSQGWFVGAFARDRDALNELAAELPDDRYYLHALDVTDDEGWDAAIAAFSAKSNGRLHLLVNNAGIAELGSFGETSTQVHLNIIDVNLAGLVRATKACLRLLEATEGAHIVNVSSIAAFSGWSLSPVYSATKAAIYSLTETLADEFSDRGITVREVLPGFVDTGLIGDDGDRVALRAATKQLGVSWSSPDRVAAAILKASEGGGTHQTVGSQAVYYRALAWMFPSIGRRFTRLVKRRMAGGSGKDRKSQKPGTAIRSQ